MASIWGILYADDTILMSQSPEADRKIMVLITTVWVALANKGDAPCRQMRSRTNARRFCRETGHRVLMGTLIVVVV